MIVWNGVSSDEVGVIVEHYPRVIIPKRKVESYQVPGRNGDIIIEQDAFENYDQDYSVFLDAERYGGLEAVIPRLSAWLYGGKGYRRLEDSYFPDFYRLARLENGQEFSNWFGIYGQGTLTFNCAPEKFYKIGEKEIIVTNGQKLINPGLFKSNPIISFFAPGAVGVNANDPIVITFTTDGASNTIELANDTSGYVTIDTKKHTIIQSSRTNDNGVYTYTDTPISSKLTGEYEAMQFGKETVITWGNNKEPFYDQATNGTPGLRVIPNWWTV